MPRGKKKKADLPQATGRPEAAGGKEDGAKEAELAQDAEEPEEAAKQSSKEVAKEAPEVAQKEAADLANASKAQGEEAAEADLPEASSRPEATVDQEDGAKEAEVVLDAQEPEQTAKENTEEVAEKGPDEAQDEAEDVVEAAPAAGQAQDAGPAEPSNAGAGQAEQGDSKAARISAKLEGLKAEGREGLKGLLNAKVQESAESEFLAAYSVAEKFMGDGEYANAVAGWQEVIRLRPGLEDPWSHRGSAKIKLGDFEGAIADYREAIKRDPSKADTWFSLGSAQSDMGNDRAAQISFNKTLKLNPRHIEALCCLGTVKLSKGDTAGAIENCTAALAVDIDCAAARGLRGAARHMTGDFVGAVSDCCESLRLDPELDWVRGMRDQARQSLVAQGREGDGERRDRGNENFKRGKLRDAIGEYSLAVANKEERWVLSLSNRAICHLRLGEHAEALSDAEYCLEQDATILKAHFTLFKALAAMGKWLQAFAALRRLRELPSTPESDAAADKEESAKRREFSQFLEAGGRIGDSAEFLGAGGRLGDIAEEDAEEAGAAEHARGEGLARAVRLAVPRSQPPLALLDVLALWKDEDPFCLASELQLADECRIRVFNQEFDEEHVDEMSRTCNGRRATTVFVRAPYPAVAKVSCAEDVPSLVVLCCPDLQRSFDAWAPTIQHLVTLGCLTVVCGLSTDLSAAQNEDVLRSLGCNIACPTSLSPPVVCVEGQRQQFHVCAFSGGEVDEDFDESSFKRRLRERGLAVFDCDSSSSSSDEPDEENDG